MPWSLLWHESENNVSFLKSRPWYHRNYYHYLCIPVVALLRHHRMILSSLPMLPSLSNLLLSNRNRRLGYKLPYHVLIHHKGRVYLHCILAPSLGYHQNMIYRSLTIDPILAIHQDKVEISNDYQIDFRKKTNHSQQSTDRHYQCEKMKRHQYETFMVSWVGSLAQKRVGHKTGDKKPFSAENLRNRVIQSSPKLS